MSHVKELIFTVVHNPSQTKIKARNTIFTLLNWNKSKNSKIIDTCITRMVLLLVTSTCCLFYLFLHYCVNRSLKRKIQIYYQHLIKTPWIYILITFSITQPFICACAYHKMYGNRNGRPKLFLGDFSWTFSACSLLQMYYVV